MATATFNPEATGRKPGGIELGRVGLYLFLILTAAFFVLPLYVMVVTSFKEMDEIRDGQIFLLPQTLHIDAWRAAWSTDCGLETCSGISQGFWNSVKITVPATVISVLIGAFVGYILSFWKPKGANVLFGIIVLAGFIPLQVFVYPTVRIIAFFDLYGTLSAVILVHVLFSLPLTVLLFRNYYAAVPHDLFQAARIDGAGFIRIFFSLMLPMAIPMLVVAGLLQFNAIWNDFLLGMVFAGRDNQPMMVQLNNIVNVTFGEVQYNVNMAATLLTAAVPLLAYFVSGRWFVRGITAGAVKG
ncbi:carbohydrate ABC transporter permease [Pseudooceanicola marinus]|uniref:carbohydrate ABC transporter permease n=1 Tax=Pseudooceanicola marinus TaxID=396013 RepID=UPI001CD27A82|nr:carbohydrate ABC transporter permease [Pseudooceanicola marinus]MCA1338061.1 carbohydrate ABC transporter permease [Pseudooceanicola marinus]